ncbi:MAG: hypothetical protein WCT32_01175 [Patescibacteria group bacterium]|jgi:hypothetical protein
MDEVKPHSRYQRLFYFWIGIVATFVYRSIIVLTNYDPIWTKVAWYIGTVGFIFYFAHRYAISEKRERLIVDHQLVKKVAGLDGLDEADKAVMKYILETLVSSREQWNYIFIFATSGIALIIGIYLDFIR